MKEKHWYQADYGFCPGEHLFKTVIAADELDAISKIYALYPAAIINDVYRIGK